MRALLCLCLPLIAFAAPACHGPAEARAGSRAPAEGRAPGDVVQPRPERPVEVERDLASGTAVPSASVEAASAVLASPPSAAPTAEPSDPAEDEVLGTIVARQGSRITIRMEDDPAIATGEHGQLLRHFERRLGSATVTGWLDIARVTVLARDGRSLDLSIDEETARVMINGRKQDQFRVGFRVRLQAT